MAEPFNYFCYDPECDGLTFHTTASEAQARAQDALDKERDCAGEGWSESVTDICWGRVKERVHLLSKRLRRDGDPVDATITHIEDYGLRVPGWTPLRGRP